MFSSTKTETLEALEGEFETGKNENVPNSEKGRATLFIGIALPVAYCLEKIRRIRRIIIPRSKILFAGVFD